MSASTLDVPTRRTVRAVGTDTTWLALGKAKRLCRTRQKVGLFCRSKGLGMFLRDNVQDWRQAVPVHTGEFREYAGRLAAHGTRKRAAPNGLAPLEDEALRRLLKLAMALPEDMKFDSVVVIEADDFTPLEWQVLLQCLKNPFGGGIFRFGDELDAPTIAPGLPVRFTACFTDDAADVACDSVSALVREGWARNQIAVLTTGDRHPLHDASLLEAGSPSDYWRAFHDGDAEFHGQVREFRGLERPAVVLCINGFDDVCSAADQMRIGLSRARSLLVLVGNPAVIEAAAGPAVAMSLVGSKLRPVALPELGSLSPANRPA